MNLLASDSFPPGTWTVHTFFFSRGMCFDAGGMSLFFNQYHLFLTVFFIYLFVFSVATVKIIFVDMEIIASIIVFALLIFTPVKGLVQPAHQLGLMRDIFNFMSFISVWSGFGFFVFPVLFFSGMCCSAQKKHKLWVSVKSTGESLLFVLFSCWHGWKFVLSRFNANQQFQMHKKTNHFFLFY